MTELRLTHTFDGTGYPVDHNSGLPNWDRPERISGLFRVVLFYDWNRTVVVGNGEGKSWAVPQAELRLAAEAA